MARKFESSMTHIDVTLESSEDEEETDYEDPRAIGDIHYEMFGRVAKKRKACSSVADDEKNVGEEHIEMYSCRTRTQSDSSVFAKGDRECLLESQEIASNFALYVPLEIQFEKSCQIKVYLNKDVDQQRVTSDIDLSVTVNGRPVPFIVKSGQFPLSFEFCPVSADDHVVCVKFRGYDVQGSPAVCKVVFSSIEGAANNLLLQVLPWKNVESPVEFIVDAKQGRQKKDDSWNVTVDSANGEKVAADIKEFCDVLGNQMTPITYTFLPRSDGSMVSVKIGDHHVEGSPANVQYFRRPFANDLEESSCNSRERNNIGSSLPPIPEKSLDPHPTYSSSFKRYVIEQGQQQPEYVQEQTMHQTTSTSRQLSNDDYEALGSASGSYTYSYYPTGRSSLQLMPKQVLEDIALYRTNRRLRHVDPVEYSSVQVTIGQFDPNTTTHVKITREAFKMGIEKRDVELLDVVIPFWKKLKEDGQSWHPMIQIAKENNASLFSRLALKHELHIPEPHDYFCSKENCPVKDSLKHSLLRINTYKALAQPAHLLAKEDPIRDAFELRRQIMEMSNLDKEFKNEYILLSDNVEKFCCDMAKLCGRKKELEIFLDRSHIDLDKEKSKLGTVEMGCKYEAKQFVAHEFVQSHLHEEFYGESPEQQKFFLKHNNFTRLLMCIVLSPVVLLMIVGYILFGGIKILKEKYPIPFYYINALKDPIIKFYIHTMCYILFLFLLLVYTLLPLADNQSHRNTGFSWIQWCIAFYILGYVWAEVKQLCTRGYGAYLLSVYNWLDSLMVFLYLASYACRVVALFKTKDALNFQEKYPVGPYPEEVQYYLETDRSKWSASDPEILADSMFAVASLLSFARLSYILPAFEKLGPLLVILGKVLRDTLQFLALFVIVFDAFLVGIHNLYKFYPNSTFSSFGGSFDNLFWGVFAMTDRDSTSFNSQQAVVEAVGFLMFGTFHVLIVIMLLNMLIAMLSTSYETTEERKDVEWKFSRAGLWLDYILKCETLPVPFNIIPTVNSAIRICIQLKALCGCGAKLARRRVHKVQKSKKKHDNFRVQYLNLMKKLKLKYAKSILDGQDIAVSINEVNHEVIDAPVQEPSTSQAAACGDVGVEDISRQIASQPLSRSLRDNADGRVARPTLSDPLRDLLLKYFKKGTFSESYTVNVINELRKSRLHSYDTSDTI